MSQLVLNSSWNAYGGKDSLVLSVSEFRDGWLWGIPTTSINGGQLTDQAIKSKILMAQTFVENFLGIKLTKQYIEESQDFVSENFYTWGYIKTNWTINKPMGLLGRLNEQTTITYPVEWLTTQKDNVSNSNATNNLYIIPNGMNAVAVSYLAVTFSQWFGFHGARLIPNYWFIKYCTGFDTVPNDIVRLIGLLAAVDVLMLIELGVRIFAGAGSSFGMASSSLSLDGMSQSVSKMNGGNIFQNRIKNQADEIQAMLIQLKYSYGGIKFDVC